MTLILGIDDAGRGPVLGPMVLAGVLIKKKDEDEIKSWGAKDSKLLTPSKRAEIKEKIESKFKFHLETASPKEIDDSSNLNYLEAIHAAKIINELTKDSKEKIKAIIDCPSTNIESWCNDVKNLVDNSNVKVICEHKADFNHPIVSAASILAKEKREAEMKTLRKSFQIDFGSGYPADPKTKEFISKNFDNKKYKSIIRFSWKTVKKLIKEKEAKQTKLFQ